MDKEKYRSADWQENKLKELYYAFGTSEEEGLKLFLNLVFELWIYNPSFLEKLYHEIEEIRNEGIYEVTEKTLELVEFWKAYNNSDQAKNPFQLEKLMALKDFNYLTQENLGRLYFQLGVIEGQIKNHETAARHYEESLRLLPNWSWAYNNLGVVYDDLGRHDEAIAAYQQAIELDPKDAKAYNNLGNVYDDLGRHEDAIAAYKKAIELAPKYATPHTGLGYLFLKEGKLRLAIFHLEKAIALDANAYVPIVNLGIAYFHLKDRKNAQAQFRSALEKCPIDSVHGRLNKVTALLGLEQNEEALQLLQQTKENFNISPGEKEIFSTDWNLLANSPEPPAGIGEFLERAKQILKA